MAYLTYQNQYCVDSVEHSRSERKKTNNNNMNKKVNNKNVKENDTHRKTEQKLKIKFYSNESRALSVISVSIIVRQKAVYQIVNYTKSKVPFFVKLSRLFSIFVLFLQLFKIFKLTTFDKKIIKRKRTKCILE